MKTQVKREIVLDYEVDSLNVPPQVVFPTYFKEVLTICDSLKKGQDIIVNLMHLCEHDKLRLLDFILGFSYGMNIYKKRLETNVYLFSHVKL